MKAHSEICLLTEWTMGIRGTMFRSRANWIIASLIGCLALAGCRSGTQVSSATMGSGGNSTVVLAITDTPPSNVSILSAEVTLTGATLNPGNVPIFSGSVTIELTRLQTDIGYLATTNNIVAGNYTGVSLTFANPQLTIQNDTANPIVSGATTCAVGAICTIAPTTVKNLSTTISLPLSVAASSSTGLLVDVNLENLLSATMGADFSAGTTVSSFTPAGAGAPLVGAEDVVGQVTALSTTTNTFTIQNAVGTYALAVDSTSSFFQFPSTVCTTASISCLRLNQIVSVDIGIRADGTIDARNVVFEDADNTDAEVEGVITSTDAAAQQFSMVAMAISSTTTGINIGSSQTVHYMVSPQTPFVIDFAHADNIQVMTAGYLFAAPTDLAVGQQVSIRRNSASSGSSLVADRVLLRSSRITALVQTVGAPYLNLYTLPPIFSGNGITQIQAQTSPPTILTESSAAIVFTEIPISGVVSVRGPLFNVSGSRTLVATKVVLQP